MVVVLGGLVLTVLTFVSLIYFVQKKRVRYQGGVQLLQAFRMLIKHLQVHRGLVAAYLSGNSLTKDGIKNTADSVLKDIAMIGQLDETLGDNQHWNGITCHWARLSHSGRSLGTFDNYQQHCKLVAACLDLMLSSARHHGVSPYQGKHGDIYWYNLLLLGEQLGQIRALGVIVLTKPVGHRDRLQSIKRIREAVTGLEKRINLTNLKDLIKKQDRQELATFIALVEHYIFEGKAWMTGEQFFAQATDVMEIVFTYFDEQLQKLVASGWK